LAPLKNRLKFGTHLSTIRGDDGKQEIYLEYSGESERISRDEKSNVSISVPGGRFCLLEPIWMLVPIKITEFFYRTPAGVEESKQR
jgi:hypothetical protein